jgi:arylsulfatase A-like enzyme
MNIRARSLAASLLVSLLANGLAAAAALQSTQPNVLLIITDQQTVRALSCAGNRDLKTPALDSLAARGVRFEKSYCTYPLCSPSRASQVTSRMPHELGIYGNTKQHCPGIPSSIVTVGDVFRSAGYETVWAGKWHVPDPYPGFQANGSIPGFDVLPLEGPKHRSNTNTAPGLGSDPATTKAAVKFLEQPHAKPFFLTVSILNPHDICEYPREPQHFPTPGPDAVLPALPANFAALANEPSVVTGMRTRQNADIADWRDRQWRTYGWVYNRMVEHADGLIGQVLAALEKSGQADNTIILFTSDHGEMGGSHQLRTKSVLYEEAVAVPLIICLPGQKPKPFVDSTHLVSGLDVMPTLCDLAGVPVPTNAAMEGVSLRSLLEQKPVNWRHHLIMEVGPNNDARAVRTDRYKYIAYGRGQDREQLFDLQADPGETTNLVADPASKSVLEEHRRLLNEWIARTKDAFGQAQDSASPRKGRGKNNQATPEADASRE